MRESGISEPGPFCPVLHPDWHERDSDPNCYTHEHGAPFSFRTQKAFFLKQDASSYLLLNYPRKCGGDIENLFTP